MKKSLLFLISFLLIAVSVASQGVAEWMLVGNLQEVSDTVGSFADTDPSIDDMELGAMGHLGVASYPLVPMQVDQVVVSLKGYPDVSATLDDNIFSSYSIHSGVQIEKFSSIPSSPAYSENNETDMGSPVVFVGISVDFGDAFVKGNAFLGKPGGSGLAAGHNQREPLAPEITGFEFDPETYGFEASAGYQVNEKLALGAGFGRLRNGSKNDHMTDEVWAVYAQAILSLAPGIQIVPEVGQIELQNEKQNNEKTDFYYGAKWEINF